MTRIHLIGVCGTAMATLAALLKSKGYDVRGSDQNVYPPMSDFLRAAGHHARSRATAPSTSPPTSISSSSATPSRAATPSSRKCSIGRSATARCPKPSAITSSGRARSIVIAGTHGKTTTTALTGWLLTARRRRSERAHRRHRRELRQQLPHRRRPRVRHRGRRVRQRVLRQDREVPEVPARHRRRQQHRVRPRRHLSGPRRHPAGVPAVREPDPAARPAAARRRQRRRRWRCATRAHCRVETFGLSTAPTGRRTICRSTGDVDDVRRAPRRRRRRARSSCRCSAPTTSATRSRRSRSARAVGLSTDTMAAALRALQGRAPAAAASRHRRAASRSTTTSRTIRRRSRETLAGVRSAYPGPPDLGDLRAAFGDVVPAGVPGGLRAGASATADRVILPAVFRSTLPEAERLSAEQLVADLQGAGSRRALHPRRSTTSSRPSRARARDGDLVVVMSNGGFDDIHQKLLTALEARRPDR